MTAWWINAGKNYDAQNNQEFSRNLKSFYAGRARRLLPVLSLMSLSILAVGWGILLPDEFRELGLHTVAGSVFLQNALLWREINYFDSGATSKPLLHLWSLAIEGQFYLVVPWIIKSKIARKRPCLFTGILMALCVCSWCLSVMWKDVSAVFYTPFSRAWEFLLGALLAIIQIYSLFSFKPVPNKQLIVVSSVGFVLIIVSLVFIRHDWMRLSAWALLPMLGTILYLWALPVYGVGVNNQPWNHPCLVGIGKLSYALYLWHWPLLAFAKIFYADYPPWIVRLIMSFFALVLAWLSTNYWEALFRRKVQPWSLNRLLVLWGGIACVGAVAAAGMIEPRLSNESLQRIVKAVGDWDFPGALPRNFVQGTQVEMRTLKASSFNERALFWGDSHVEQYGPRLVKLAKDAPQNWKSVDFITAWACPPIFGVEEATSLSCQKIFDAALKVALSPEVQTVVIGGCWNCYFIGEMQTVADPNDPYRFSIWNAATGQHHGFRDPESQAKQLAFDALQNLLLQLKNAGKQVFLLLDNPSGEEFNPKHHVQGQRWGAMQSFDMPSTAVFSEAQIEVHRALKKIAQQAGVRTLDPIPTLCSDLSLCRRASLQGDPFYKDDNHLRPWVVKEFGGYIDEAFRVGEGR
jgi:peptidoglycan/LPS O-acetylase OafA/YrhL